MSAKLRATLKVKIKTEGGMSMDFDIGKGATVTSATLSLINYLPVDLDKLKERIDVLIVARDTPES